MVCTEIFVCFFLNHPFNKVVALLSLSPFKIFVILSWQMYLVQTLSQNDSEIMDNLSLMILNDGPLKRINKYKI